MEDIVLYCKSYYRDLKRAARLAESIRRFNPHDLPFYLSCPMSDLPLFKDTIGNEEVVFFPDEEIVAANPALRQQAIDALPGSLSQQIIKSEFWRLNISKNYLCLDSDSYFIRDFAKDDFLTHHGIPYTVMNGALELRLFAALQGHDEITSNINTEGSTIMEFFGRVGKQYEFGPTPVVWNRQVWSDLADKFLAPRGMNFYDAIKLFPTELRWYGEALLMFRSIELWPIEAFFRCYHYEQLYRAAKKAGETDEMLKAAFLGVCIQSAWDRQSEYGYEKRWLSDFARSFKSRILRRLV